MTDKPLMETFKAKGETTFRYRSDLSEMVYIQFWESQSGSRVAYRGNIVTTVQMPLEDLLEFAAHVARVPESSEAMATTAAAYVMDQLRRLGLFNRVSAEKENDTRELLCKLFSGQTDRPLDDYDRETQELVKVHLLHCELCAGRDTRCENYWRVMLDRARAKNRREVQ